MASTSGITQMVQNGEIVDTSASGKGGASVKKKASSSLDKDAFLQLLVAQMKYQDPLEPTSNTEYISQLATFSSLEEMQNLNSSMTNMQAANLVGKQVVMKVTSEVTGTTTTVAGYVDYVTRENNKTYLVVNGNPYSIDDLESVVDESYLEAISLADSFKEAMAKLPDKKYVTLDDKKAIEAVRDVVNSMNAYQQSFLDADGLIKLKELLEQLAKLEEAAGKDEDDKTDGTDGTDGTGGTDGTDGTDGTGGTDGADGTGETDVTDKTSGGE